MKCSRKKLFSVSTLLYAVCVTALIGSGNAQSQEMYEYSSIRQSDFVQTTDNYDPYQSSIPVVYQDAEVVNPYQAEELVELENVVVEDTKPCYAVENGQIGSPSNVVFHKETTPCAQKNTVVEVATCNCVQSDLNCPCSEKKKQDCGCEQKEQKCACFESGKITTTGVDTTNSSMVNIETPARCQIALHNNELTYSIALDESAFKLIPLDGSDELPRYEVNDYTFKDLPLDIAIQNLVSEAGIRVYSDDALFPEISGEHIRGELSVVISELAAAGDVFFSYDAAKKHLILSRWGRFVMKVPGKRIGMYTVLDALRGANITNLQPDFGANEIYMRVNIEKKKTIEKLVNAIKASSNLLLFDIQVYRLAKTNPEHVLNWQDVAQIFGVQRINTSVNGIVGRLLSTKHQPNNKNLIDVLKMYGSVNLISEGVAIMPDNWKVSFDIGQCVKFSTPEQSLSMTFQSNILSGKRAESNISLDTADGEITSYHTVYSIDDTLDIIGIPGQVFNPAWGNSIEYVITLKPRLVRLVK
ncbi:MAG: hypothetical protein E7013_05555 [Alphaproteobacteria bacterium]|nr:hypothetical protein [Alphaproteobacteria bacterium]